MLRTLPLVVTFAALLVVSGCHKSTTPPPSPPSPSATINGFHIDLGTSPPSLKITSADGRTLLDSYTSGTVPYLAFASRVSSARYDEDFGAFNITETPQAWSAGDALVVTESSSTKMAFTVNASGSALLNGTIEAAGDGTLKLSLTAVGQNDRVSLAMKCADDDHFLGFGAQTDAADHHGHTVPIWVSEQGIGKSSSDDPPNDWQIEGARHSTYWSLPYYVSSRGYGLLLQSSRRSIFELCSKQSDAFRIEAWDPNVELLLFDGPDVASVVTRATNVMGRQPAATPLELAPWNDGIFGSANVRRIAAELRDGGIPSSVIWTEDFRGGIANGTSYRISDEWDVDRTLYPDAEQVASDLHAQGFRWLAYFNTFLAQGSRVYDAATDAGVFVEDGHGKPYLFEGATFVQTGLLDLSSQAGRDFMSSYLNQALDIGFDGWMADYAEWLPANAQLADGSDPEAAHNLYPIAWQTLNHQVISARTDGAPRTFFVRSGYIGSNPLVPAVWGGDQRTDFEPDDGLPTVVPIGLSLGLSGIGTYGSDIAGYQSATNPTSTKELFFRWTEVGALSPLMRTHHGTEPTAEWSFESDAETFAHYKRYAQLHIKLYPYLQALSNQAAATGVPIMRQLAFSESTAAEDWTTYDEYLLGPQLLVAPVMTQGATSRNVFFPSGTWIPLLGGAPVTGGSSSSVDAPMSEIPAFARAGTILPMLPDSVQTLVPADPTIVTLDQVKTQRELWIYLGASGSAQEADGTTYNLFWSPQGTPDQVTSNGQVLRTCSSPTDDGPCATINVDSRTATIKQFTSPLVIQAGGASLASVTVQGTRTRLDAVVHW
ncbi:MAG: hypothetical protein JST54_32230 [Deltaproteobacteria bacterium]|nr:hypothetical protein [Deltaproteobacteria bacterium]